MSNVTPTPLILSVLEGRVEINVDMLPGALRENRPNRSDCNEAADVVEQLLAMLRKASQTTPATAGGELSRAAIDVLAERRRQIEVEGWTPEHDDEHGDGSLARAAACYFLGCTTLRATPNSPDIILWPWEASAWKQTDRRRMLVNGTALALAEIEREDRKEARHG